MPRWLLRLLADLGLTSADGRLSFTKAVVVTILAGATRDPVMAAIIIAAAYGRTTFTTWLERASFGLSRQHIVQELTQRSTQHVSIEQRRDPALGIELPAPAKAAA